MGFALELQRDQLGTYERLMSYGDVVRVPIGLPGLRFEMHCVFHPDGVQRVLGGWRTGYLKRDRFYRQLAHSFGWGLVTSEGERWERQRRLIQPLFTQKSVASYAELMAEEAAATAASWSRTPASDALDAHAAMVRLTLRVVGRAIFGEDMLTAERVINSAYPELTRHTARRVLAIAAPPANWPTPANRRLARAQRELHALFDVLIEQRRQADAPGDDLLSLLVDARDADGTGMDTQQIRDEAVVFLFAGHETTALALTFALQLLGTHQGEQERVRDEIDRVLGDRMPTNADVRELGATARAIKEAMRLYPPTFALARAAESDDEIRGCRIPRGSLVLVCQWATHRHPDFWEDPGTFSPDRFLPEREASRHRHAYFPFGAGPRSCIGYHFAMQEAVIALAVLLRRFRVRAELASVPLECRLTLRPDGPVPIRVEPR